MLLKTGILLEWARIFVPQGFKNAFWWTCHSVIVVNVMFYVICTFVEIFGCNPRRKLWEPTLPGTCMDMAKVNIVSASINFASDVIILFLPQKVIWGLHMSLKKKFGVGTLFAVGVLYVPYTLSNLRNRLTSIDKALVSVPVSAFTVRQTSRAATIYSTVLLIWGYGVLPRWWRGSLFFACPPHLSFSPTRLGCARSFRLSRPSQSKLPKSSQAPLARFLSRSAVR